MNYKIWIVEDDIGIAELLSGHLKKYGFDVICCENFENLMDEFYVFDPHLVLMDINLPVFDGFHWCQMIRKTSKCPILFISAKNENSAQVFGMESGGDDYITKPFSFEIITAKINAQLRRVYGSYAENKDDDIYCVDCNLSPRALMLHRGEKSVNLSKNEVAVLKLFFEAYPQVVPRKLLLDELWDTDEFVEENTLNVNISRVRKRLEEVGSNISVKAVRGIGYRMEKENEV